MPLSKTIFMSALVFNCLSSFLIIPTFAGAVIELFPTTPGPYSPGSEVEVDFYIRQDPPGPHRGLRNLQFDFSDTHSGLQLSEFKFDGSSMDLGLAVHAVFPQWYFLIDSTLYGPLASLDYIGTNYPNGDPFDPFEPPPWNTSMLVLPPSSSIRVGSIDINLPSGSGLFRLDVLGTHDPNFTDHGAHLGFGFGLYENDQVTFWYPSLATTASPSDHISSLEYFFVGNDSGAFDFIGVPEPTTMMLLVGAVWLSSIRKRPIS